MGRKPQYYEYDETINNFLNSQKETTKGIYRCNFRYIIDFSGLTGKEILESKKNDKDFTWERKAVELKQWAKEKGLSDSLAKGLVAILRSFFVYYRTPLVFTKAEINKVGGRVQRTTQDYSLTNEDISKLVFVANLREKYIVLGGKSFGLRAIDFIQFSYGTFRSVNLNQETPIALGEINTIKEGVPAFPFIDSDLQPVIKAILEAGISHTDSEQILTFNENELSTVLQGLAKKANIQLGDKHLRFHCFRKYLCDRLSSVMSDQKWKQIVGKTISEGAYISSFELRESYAKVMKMTTINGNGNGKVSKVLEEMQSMQGEFQLTKSQLADIIAKQQKDGKELANIIIQQQKDKEKLEKQISDMYTYVSERFEPIRDLWEEINKIPEAEPYVKKAKENIQAKIAEEEDAKSREAESEMDAKVFEEFKKTKGED